CREPTVIVSNDNTVIVGTRRGEIHCLDTQMKLLCLVETREGPINYLKFDDNDFNFLWVGYGSGELKRMNPLESAKIESQENVEDEE
ncbi:hypothetical protein PENTCL1PPCAC_20014, partial [Pristionchus entomophagus]